MNTYRIHGHGWESKVEAVDFAAAFRQGAVNVVKAIEQQKRETGDVRPIRELTLTVRLLDGEREKE